MAATAASAFVVKNSLSEAGRTVATGGTEADVYLVANPSINTLVDFRVARKFKAESGQPGAGRNKTGRSGEDLAVAIPCGTVIRDVDTGELIGDLTKANQRIKVAEAGHRGLGNTRFKSSINRAPRKITHGTPGEKRHLALELKLLADVGLVGMPNAGKSTLIRSMSAARPKVADYPFTTLHPNLGVVSVGPLHSFVMADVPGLIEGAAEGAGLGIQFLKHLQRTRLLLHLVDIAPLDSGEEPADAVLAIQHELLKYSDQLADKPRWLVINKTDLLDADELGVARDDLVQKISWDGPVFEVSAASGEGTEALGQAVMRKLDEMNEAEQDG